jgi:hypothetical protein
MLIKDYISENKPSCGIYAITCNKTWRSYVGQSINTVNRAEEHIWKLNKNKHASKYLQEDFHKFGVESLYIEVLEECDHSKLIERETYWIKFGSNLYNETLPVAKTIKPLSQKDIDRFWSFVDIKQKNDCWIWTRINPKKDMRIFVAIVKII